MVVVAALVACGARARAEQPDRYQRMDAARPLIIAALDQGDGRALAAFVPTPFETRLLWFSSAGCRKRFGDATVTAAELGALARCFAEVGVRLSGLEASVGPGVAMTVRLEVVDGKVRIHSLNGSQARASIAPRVARVPFEANRTAGDPSPPAAAKPLLAAMTDGMASFDVCLDRTGKVTSHQLAPGVANQPLDSAIAAAVRAWRFKPFLVRGKPVAVCSTVLWSSSS